jgi:excisionase family DNA binding protein
MTVAFEPLLTPDAAASLLQIHRGTLLRWARENRIPSLRLTSRKIAFRASDLDAWLTNYNCAAVRAA